MYKNNILPGLCVAGWVAAFGFITISIRQYLHIKKDNKLNKEMLEKLLEIEKDFYEKHPEEREAE